MFTETIKTNTIIYICLFLAIVTALTSCNQPSSRSKAPEPKNENILRFDVAAPFESLNPTELKQLGSNLILPLLYSYLCVPDENGILQPDLAESWTYNPETFTWTVTLHTDARFHNGQSVNSTDVRYSLDSGRYRDQSGLLSSIKEISILSDSVFSIRLNKNDPEFMSKISDIEIIAGSDHGDIDYNDHPIGSGPFQFDKRFGKKKVFLSANPDYYHGRPKIDGVIFTYEPDKEKIWARLLAGETDAAQEISPKNFEIIKQYEDRFYFNYYTWDYYSILLYNMTDPLFSNADVRRAMTMAIDRQYIVDHLLNGFAKVAIGPMGVDSSYHNPDLKPLPYDPIKAVELLHQAGWTDNPADGYLFKNGRPFEFTLFISKEYGVEKKIARYIQLCFSDVGIKMNISSLPLEDFADIFFLDIDFQALLAEFSCCTRKPENLKNLWWENPSNCLRNSGFYDPEIAHLLDQMLAENNSSKRKEYLYQLDALIAAKQPGTFLFQNTAIDIMSKRFSLHSPFDLSNLGIYRLKDASLFQN